MVKQVRWIAWGLLMHAQAFAQMTYEGRLTPNESRGWLYGSLTIFGLLLLLVYNLEKISPWIRERFRKFTGRN